MEGPRAWQRNSSVPKRACYDAGLFSCRSPSRAAESSVSSPSSSCSVFFRLSIAKGFTRLHRTVYVTNVHGFVLSVPVELRGARFSMEVNEVKTKLRLRVEELEQRIAPSEVGQGLGIGNPGNNNPPANNTNNPGNEGTGGQVSTGG